MQCIIPLSEFMVVMFSFVAAAVTVVSLISEVHVELILLAKTPSVSMVFLISQPLVIKPVDESVRILKPVLTNLNEMPSLLFLKHPLVCGAFFHCTELETFA